MQLFSNNGLTLLQNNLAIGDLVLTVKPGTGSLFPSTNPGDFFLITLEKSNGFTREIVKVIDRSSDIFTIERALEGTQDQEWLANDIVDARNTAGTMRKLQTIRNDNYNLEIIAGNVTRIFTTAQFEINSTRLYISGLRQSLGNDYIEENSTTIQLLNPPSQIDVQNGCNIVLDYTRAYIG